MSTRMDYTKTRSSLIFYLYKMVNEDSWRLNINITNFYIVSSLYRILIDVLCEHVNVRYGNLRDANENEIIRVIEEDFPSSFKDEKALYYIRITYFLYTQLTQRFSELWRLQDKICDIIREGKYDKERQNGSST